MWKGFIKNKKAGTYGSGNNITSNDVLVMEKPTPIDNDDSKVRVIKIPESELTSLDKTGIVTYLNNLGITKLDIETIVIEVTNDINPSTFYVVNGYVNDNYTI